jgi:hypothetical protein
MSGIKIKKNKNMRATYGVKKIILGTGLLFTILGLVITTVARGDINTGAQYLSDKNDNPWVTMALIAADKNPSVEYLRTFSGSTAISYEAPILALTAADQDPRIFANDNLVSKLKSFYDGTQIGDANALNDDIFGILALRSAGEPADDTVVQSSRNFLIANQNPGGGWGWVKGGDSSVDMTAMAVNALLSSGTGAADQIIQKATDYLKAAQNGDGGFPSEPGGDSNAASTAWVISMIKKLTQSPEAWNKNGTNPITFLLSLQKSGGYFVNTASASETAFTKIETAYALIALSDKTYPIKVIEPVKFAAVHYRIEGENEVVCAGDTKAPNALALVKIVASECSVSYTIEQLSFGPYLTRIGDDTAAGLSGWLYFVNFISPEVGAADYVLEDGDEVLWYFGEFGWSPLRVTLTEAVVPSTSEAVVTVEAKTDSGWTALAGATVYLGSATEISGANGVVIKALPDGVYRVFAEKSGYVRSEKDLLTVGDKAEAAVSLSATVTAGASGGGSGSGGIGGGPSAGSGQGGSPTSSGQAGLISFILNPGALSFGSIESGKSYSKPLSVKNDGQVNIYVESVVSGDELFRNYLKVGGEAWRSFNSVVSQGEEKNLNLDLTVPGTYNTFGTKNGSLIFWAIHNQ